MPDTAPAPGMPAAPAAATADIERLMRLAAHTAVLAGVLETLLAEQLRAQTARARLEDQLGHLAARLADCTQRPLLPDEAFGRIRQAQTERAYPLRADAPPL